jgi:hypothetical protein
MSGSAATFLVASVDGAAPGRVRAVLPAAGSVVWSLLCAGTYRRSPGHQVRDRAPRRGTGLGRDCAAGWLRPAPSDRPAAREFLRDGATGAAHDRVSRVAARGAPRLVLDRGGGGGAGAVLVPPGGPVARGTDPAEPRAARRSSRPRADSVEACIHGGAARVCRRWSRGPRDRVRTEAPFAVAFTEACKGVGHVTRTSRLDDGGAGLCHGRRDCHHRGGVAVRFAGWRGCCAQAGNRGRQGRGCDAAETRLRGEAKVHTRGDAGQDRGDCRDECRRAHRWHDRRYRGHQVAGCALRPRQAGGRRPQSMAVRTRPEGRKTRARPCQRRDAVQVEAFADSSAGIGVLD